MVEKRKFRIFTNLEVEYIMRRYNGDKEDPHSIYCNRVKPKLIEIKLWNTKLKKIIDKVLPQDRKRDKDILRIYQEELESKSKALSKESFIKEHGY